MKINEIESYIDVGVTESPQLVQDTQFGLDNPMENSKLARKFLKGQYETIAENNETILIRTGDGSKGYYLLLEKDKPRINYLIKYEEMNKVLTGRTVTQVMLWRSKYGAGIDGITKKVFYEILLTKWPTIMSDSMQTSHGRDFWITRLDDASRKGFQVGMVNFNSKKVSWYDGSISFEDWLKSMDGWDTPDSYQAKRFVISKDKF